MFTCSLSFDNCFCMLGVSQSHFDDSCCFVHRHEKPQPAVYYRDNPMRTTNSHDSILDQVGQTANYYDPYQEQHHMLPTKLQYRPPIVPTQQYHHQQNTLSHYAPQYKQHKRQPSQPDYNQDHATYVNVNQYQQPTHHPQKALPSYNQYKQQQHYNKPAPAEPPTYQHAPPPHRNPPMHYHRGHGYQAKEIQPQVVYREEER